MLPALLSRNRFHTGYAIHSMDSVIATLTDKFGISQWKVVPLPEESGGRALGFAYVEHSMIELIDIVPGGVEIYNDWVPAEQGHCASITLAIWFTAAKSSTKWSRAASTPSGRTY